MQLRHGIRVVFGAAFTEANVTTLFDCLAQSLDSALWMSSLDIELDEEEIAAARSEIRRRIRENDLHDNLRTPRELGLALGTYRFSPCTPYELSSSVSSSDFGSECILTSCVYGNMSTAGDYPESYPEFTFPGPGRIPNGNEVFPATWMLKEQEEEYERLVRVMTRLHDEDADDAYYRKWNVPALAFIWCRFRGALPEESWQYFDPTTQEWETEPAALR